MAAVFLSRLLTPIWPGRWSSRAGARFQRFLLVQTERLAPRPGPTNRANRALDKVRRRVQNDTLGHRGRRDDPLYRIRHIALVAAERLDQRGWERLIAGLEPGDPDGDLAGAWLAVQLFRKVYAAGNKGAATRALNRFYRHCDQRRIPELDTLARTVRSWQYEILAYHSTGQSNGPTDAVNLLIEKVRRIGHGFRNFDNYRLRRLRCGVTWHHQPANRIRARQPRLIA